MGTFGLRQTQNDKTTDFFSNPANTLKPLFDFKEDAWEH